MEFSIFRSQLSPIVLISILLVLGACSKEKRLAKDLEGRWDVTEQQGEGKRVDSSGTKGGTGAATTVEATVGYPGNADFHFKEEGEGTYEMHVRVEIIVDETYPTTYEDIEQKGSLQWENDESSVTALLDNGNRITFQAEEDDGGELYLEAAGIKDLSFFVGEDTYINTNLMDMDIDYVMKLE